MLFFVGVSLFAPNVIKAQTIDYNYEQVPLGGGGYIIGMQIHNGDNQIRYYRTDVGGAYRWNADAQKLEQMIFEGKEKSTYFGVAGIALHNSFPNIVALAVGRYCDPNETAILISYDYGQTWSKEIIPGLSGSAIHFASNGGRSCPNGDDKDRQGNPIAFNPLNENELFIGSRNTGLWKLDILTETFTNIGTDVIPVNNVQNSIRNVVFHPQNPEVVFISYANHGIYRGNVNTNVFEALNTSNDIKDVSDLEVSANGDYMLIACKKNGIYRATDLLGNTNFTKVIDYTNQWGEGFLTVSCSPIENNKCATIDGAYEAVNTLRISNDGGLTWQSKNGQLTDNLYPWHAGGIASHTSQIAFDPFEPHGLHMTDWFTCYETKNSSAQTIQWSNVISKGHEEVVVTDLESIPLNSAGNILATCTADESGFMYSDLSEDAYPENSVRDLMNNPNNLIKGANVSYCYNEPDYIYMSCTDSWDTPPGSIVISTNGGTSFTRSTGYDESLGKCEIAVSCSEPNKLLVATEQGLKYSSDMGNTFSNSVNSNALSNACGFNGTINTTGSGNTQIDAINISIFSVVKSIASDKVIPCLFYFYNWQNGSFHVSTDYGQHFSKVYDGFPVFNNEFEHKTRITTIPDHAEHVWINFNNGLYKSENAGQNWVQMNNVQKALLFSVGKKMGNAQYPTLFLYGRANGDQLYAYYRSTDKGQTWELIHNPDENENWGKPRVLAGSLNEAGAFFIGTSGLGILKGRVAGVANNCDNENVILNPDFENDLIDWKTRTNNGAQANFSVQNQEYSSGSNAFKVECLQEGANSWDVQLKQKFIPLEAGKTYILKFDAKREVEGGIAQSLGIKNHANQANILNEQTQITSEWKTFSFEFNNTVDASAYLYFDFGLGIRYIDNVIIQEKCTECSDSDNDGVCDEYDECEGYDDNIDNDGDGIPDGCDETDDCKLVLNGNFDNGDEHWEFENYWNGAGTYYINNQWGYAKINVNDPGSDYWHIAFMQRNINYEANKTYELTFSAKSDAPRTIAIYFNSEDGEKFHKELVNINNSWNDYSFTFSTPSNISKMSGFINFGFGKEHINGRIDNIRLRTSDCNAEKINTNQERLFNSEMDIYPNPANDFLNIEYNLEDQTNNAFLQIIDISGKIVLKNNLHSYNGSELIDVSMLKKGIYIVQLISDNKGIHIEKIVIDR